MTSPHIRPGRPDEFPAFADRFRQMWLDNQVPPTSIVADYRRRVVEFLESAQGLHLFVAERPSLVDDSESDDDESNQLIGVAAAQRFAGLYPDILVQSQRSYGYIWGVWVSPDARRQGLGKALTQRCIDALRSDGCSHALLHAAPSGERIYRALGFVGTNELRLTL